MVIYAIMFIMFWHSCVKSYHFSIVIKILFCMCLRTLGERDDLLSQCETDIFPDGPIGLYSFTPLNATILSPSGKITGENSKREMSKG